MHHDKSESEHLCCTIQRFALACLVDAQPCNTILVPPVTREKLRRLELISHANTHCLAYTLIYSNHKHKCFASKQEGVVNNNTYSHNSENKTAKTRIRLKSWAGRGGAGSDLCVLCSWYISPFVLRGDYLVCSAGKLKSSLGRVLKTQQWWQPVLSPPSPAWAGLKTLLKTTTYEGQHHIYRPNRGRYLFSDMDSTCT